MDEEIRITCLTALLCLVVLGSTAFPFSPWIPAVLLLFGLAVVAWGIAAFMELNLGRRLLTAFLAGIAVSAWLVTFYSYSHTIANIGTVVLLFGVLELIFYQHHRLNHCPKIALSFWCALLSWSAGVIIAMFSLAATIG